MPRGAPRASDHRAVIERLARAVAVAGSVLLAAGTSGCTDHEAEGAALRFPGSAPSVELLGEHVLRALERGDTAMLRTFRLTEAEHNEVVWPELPASRPEVNYPAEMAWANIELRDRSALARLRPGFEGRSATLRAVECRGSSQEFATFRVRTDCWIVFEIEGADGVWEAQLFKDVLERGGGYKIFRYYEEAPRRWGDPSGADRPT